jgi:hypothetical protein
MFALEKPRETPLGERERSYNACWRLGVPPVMTDIQGLVSRREMKGILYVL